MFKYLEIKNACISKMRNIYRKDEKVEYVLTGLTKEQFLQFRNVYNLNAKETMNRFIGEPEYWIRVYPSVNYRVPSEEDFLMRDDIDVTFYLHCRYIKNNVEHYILVFDKDNITEHKKCKEFIREEIV